MGDEEAQAAHSGQRGQVRVGSSRDEDICMDSPTLLLEGRSALLWFLYRHYGSLGLNLSLLGVAGQEALPQSPGSLEKLDRHHQCSPE